MIENRIIDDKISLRDLLAQAVALGVKAGRGQIEYVGAWCVADNILNETEEVIEHRNRILGIRNSVSQLSAAVIDNGE